MIWFEALKEIASTELGAAVLVLDVVLIINLIVTYFDKDSWGGS